MNPQIASGAIPTSSYLQTDIAKQSQPTPQPTQPTKQPDFLERMLPTIGGIAGGVLGTVAAPFTGGIVNPVDLGGVLGAAGQAGENALTGKKVLQGNDISSGIENALGNAVGGVLGKVGGSVLGKVSPLLGKGASAAVAGQAVKGSIDPTLAKYLVDNGITDLGQAGKFADVLTGSSSGANLDVDGKAVVNKFVEDTLNNQGPKAVPISDLSMSKLSGKTATIGEGVASESNTLQNLIDQNSLHGTAQANAIRSTMNGITGGLKTDASGNIGALDALNVQRQVAAKANEAYDIATKTSNADMLNVAKVYNNVSSALTDRLNLPNIVVSDEDKQALANDIVKYGSPINKDAAQGVAQQIANKPDLTLADARNIESNWVRVKGALQATTLKAAKSYGTSTGDIARATLPIAGSIVGAGGKKSALGALTGLATSSPVADRASAAALSNLSKVTGKASASKILPLLIRATTVGASNIPNMAENVSADPSNPQSGNMNTGANMQPEQSVNQSPLMQAFQTAQTGGMGIGQPYTSAMTTLAPQAQKLELAAPLLEQLLGGYNQAGGSQGPLAGGLSKLTGLIPGTAANTYNREQGAAASLLAQLLGISPQSAMGSLPQLTQSPGTAAPQMSALSGALGAIQ